MNEKGFRPAPIGGEMLRARVQPVVAGVGNQFKEWSMDVILGTSLADF